MPAVGFPALIKCLRRLIQLRGPLLVSGSPMPLRSVQLLGGRENNETTQAGGYPDRWQGVYTLQVTTKANPDAGTTATGNAATGWVTIGTVTTGEAQKSATFRPWMRHLYNVAHGGNPIQATGLRIKVSWAAIDIDEIEVNAPIPVRSADTVGNVSGK